MGKKENNEVRELEAYTDTWWSSDGATWNKVNYEEGSKHTNNLYSTSEWTETTIEGRKIYRGKWGHSLEAFHVNQDIESSNIDVACPAGSSCKNVASAESKTPALFVIGGKFESGPVVNDVFVSERGGESQVDARS